MSASAGLAITATASTGNIPPPARAAEAEGKGRESQTRLRAFFLAESRVDSRLSVHRKLSKNPRPQRLEVDILKIDMTTKKELLSRPIVHLDIKQHNVVSLVDAMADMAFSSRDVHRASSIYDMMLRDTECGVILCIAGSMVSAGMKQIFIDLIRNNMVDAIVSTGANIVDQDFFEALGFKHYIAEDQYKYGNEDATLRELAIDRIYDTFIDEDELRICDDTIEQITNSLEPRAYSSREFLREMGAWLEKKGHTLAAGGVDSIVHAAYEKNVPIFIPAFSDCSAGFGLVAHQHARQGQPVVSIDSAKDFYELTKLKIENPSTGLLMVCGGVPKNFAQDIVVAAEILGSDAPMHKYAIQITVADSRDGALSGSTLKEASSWGKVDLTYEQMVYSEATLALPLIVGYAYHKQAHAARTGKNWTAVLDKVSEPVTA
jgi:deoxyhypusine synthase